MPIWQRTRVLWQGNEVILASDAKLDGVADKTRANAAGVGLNRNFPARWQRGHRHGSRPASESETP
jgi:hypothetical protein